MLKIGKAAGLDGISPRVQKVCVGFSSVSSTCLLCSRTTGSGALRNQKKPLSPPFSSLCMPRDLISNFVEWCGKNYLLHSVAKTKEMVVDYWRKSVTTSFIVIRCQEIDYRYVGVHLKNKREAGRSFSVCHKILDILDQSVLVSIVFLAAVF
ncbi:uncharacterized protein LOC121711184 [Tachysurus ichikawai]